VENNPMGRLVTVHHCPVCYYHVEDDLHYGHSGISPFFLRNHYALALCRSCRNLVSVLVANSEQQTREALTDARHDIIQMEADAVIGDRRAREMLPFFRTALDSFDGTAAGETSLCTMCGSADLEIFDAITGAQLDAQDAWVPCPRCEEGQLLIETSGAWD
jgi:hypothetical protein